MNITITGEIKDVKGVPLSGVSVSSRFDEVWKVITDVDGRFSVKTKRGDVISFRYWGYKLHEVEVDSDEDMEVDVVLKKE